MMQLLLETGVSNFVVASALALVALAASRLRVRPSVVHLLWLLVLLKLVTPPLFRVPVTLPAALPAIALDAIALDEAAVHEPPPVWSDSPPVLIAAPEAVPAPFEERSVAPVATTAVVAEPDHSWPLALGVLAVLGTLAILTTATARGRRFERLLRLARPAPASVRNDVARLARRLGLARTPEVQLVPGKLSPMLWAPPRELLRRRARILVPQELFARIGRIERITLLAHELAHLRRRDHLVRYFELVVRAIHWWNPLVWLACRELRAAEEECCDAWVVWALPDSSRGYADALLSTAEFLSESEPPAIPATASGAGAAQNLKWRLTMILRAKTPRTLNTVGRLALLALALVALPLIPARGQSAITPLHPQSARTPADPLSGFTPNHSKYKRIAGVQSSLNAQESELADMNAQLERLQALGYAQSADPKSAAARIDSLAQKIAEAEDRRAQLQDQLGLGGGGQSRASKTGALLNDRELRAVLNGAKALAELGQAEDAALLYDLAAKHQKLRHEAVYFERIVGAEKDANRRAGDIDAWLREIAVARARGELVRATELERELTVARDREAYDRLSTEIEAARVPFSENRVHFDQQADRLTRLEHQVQRLTELVEQVVRSKQPAGGGGAR